MNQRYGWHACGAVLLLLMLAACGDGPVAGGPTTTVVVAEAKATAGGLLTPTLVSTPVATITVSTVAATRAPTVDATHTVSAATNVPTVAATPTTAAASPSLEVPSSTAEAEVTARTTVVAVTTLPTAAPPFTRSLSFQPQHPLTGDDVRAVQQQLRQAGYLQPEQVDGIYGGVTASAVERFQRDHGLTVDGVVGPATWTVLWTGALPAGAPRLVFVGPDELTVQQIYPGSGAVPTTLFRFTAADGEATHVDYLSTNATAANTGTAVLYRIETDGDAAFGQPYYVYKDGHSQLIGTFAGVPRWSPDGQRLAGNRYDAATEQYSVVVYELATGQTTRLKVAGGVDWFPDGHRLLIAGRHNVGRVDLAAPNAAQVLLTHLPEPAEPDDTTWEIQEAHVMNATTALLYARAGRASGLVGPTFNWYRLPLGGGTPQPLTGDEGYGVDYAAAAGRWAYSEHVHGGACGTLDQLHIRQTTDVGKDLPGPFVPKLALDTRVTIRGLAWLAAPQRVLAYGLEPYTCPDGTARLEPAHIYLWHDVGPGGVALPEQVAAGRFPGWLGGPRP